MSRLLHAVIAGALATAVARAAEVTAIDAGQNRIEITQSLNRNWAPGEAVCVVRAGAQLGCGFILDASARGARVQLTLTSGDRIRKGDYVDRVATAAQVFQVLVDKKIVLITHEANRHWQAGDTVCLYRKHETLGCGDVGNVRESTAQLELTFSSGLSLRVGDSAREAPGKTRIVKLAGNNHVVLAQNLVRPWKEGETFGIVMQGNAVAWGVVLHSYPLSVEGQLLVARAEFDEGDWAKPMPLPEDVGKNAGPRDPAAAVLEDFKFRDNHRQFVSLGLLMEAIRVGYDRALLPRVTAGGAFLAAKGRLGGGGVQWWGVLGTLTYFPGVFPKGLWFQLGMGLARLTADRAGVEETFFTPMVTTMAGWRWSLSYAWTIGAGAGVLALTRTSGDQVFLNSSGVLPSAQLDLAVNF